MVCFDSTQGKTIRFCRGVEIGEVKPTGRSKTRIAVPVPVSSRLIADCNSILADLRRDTSDTVLSPFKGNTRAGERRRRLDFATARKIITLAIECNAMKIAA